MAVAGPARPSWIINNGSNKRKRDDDDDEKNKKPSFNEDFFGPLEEDRGLFRPAIVLVIGDSFIRRLQQFEHSTYGHYHNMSLLYDVCHINWYGIGGLTIPRMRSMHMDILREMRPDVVVLQLGTNDLCDPQVSAPLVSADLQFLVQNIHSLGVHHVMVGQTINRQRQGVPAHTNVTNFNWLVSQLNTATDNALAHSAMASFWSHRGLWDNRRNIMARDGVHLNRFGNCLLYRSIRGAILHGVRRARPNLRW